MKKKQLLEHIDAVIKRAEQKDRTKKRLKLPSGKFWLAIWGFVALARFAVGLPIDPIFLGVLGIYSGSKWLKGKADEKETPESE